MNKWNYFSKCWKLAMANIKWTKTERKVHILMNEFNFLKMNGFVNDFIFQKLNDSRKFMNGSDPGKMH